MMIYNKAMKKIKLVFSLLLVGVLVITIVPIFADYYDYLTNFLGEKQTFTSTTTYTYKYLSESKKDITITEDHSINYWLHKPNSYDENKEYPIIVYIAGSDACEYLQYGYKYHSYDTSVSTLKESDDSYLIQNIYGNTLYKREQDSIPGYGTSTLIQSLYNQQSNYECFVLYLQLPDEMWWRNLATDQLTIRTSSVKYSSDEDVYYIGRVDESNSTSIVTKFCNHQYSSVTYNETNKYNEATCEICKETKRTYVFNTCIHSFDGYEEVEGVYQAECTKCHNVYYFDKDGDNYVEKHNFENEETINGYAVKTCTLCHEDFLFNDGGTLFAFATPTDDSPEDTYFTQKIGDKSYIFLIRNGKYILQHEVVTSTSSSYYSAMYSSTYLASTVDTNIYSQLLTQLLDELLVEYSIDPTRQNIAGFSIGATFAFDTISHYPDRFSSALLVAPTTIDVSQENCEKLSNMKIWLFNGNNDTRCNKYLAVKFCEAMKKVYNEETIGSCQYTFFNGTHSAPSIFIDCNTSINNIDTKANKNSKKVSNNHEILDYVFEAQRTDMNAKTYLESQENIKNIAIVKYHSEEKDTNSDGKTDSYDVILVAKSNIKYTTDVGFVFKFSEPNLWVCSNCGKYTQSEIEPEVCTKCLNIDNYVAYYCENEDKIYFVLGESKPCEHTLATLTTVFKHEGNSYTKEQGDDGIEGKLYHCNVCENDFFNEGSNMPTKCPNCQPISKAEVYYCEADGIMVGVKTCEHETIPLDYVYEKEGLYYKDSIENSVKGKIYYCQQCQCSFFSEADETPSECLLCHVDNIRLTPYNNEAMYKRSITQSCECQAKEVSLDDGTILRADDYNSEYIFAITLTNIPSTVQIETKVYEINSFGYNYSDAYQLKYASLEEIGKKVLFEKIEVAQNEN